jgi:hypothetical protein
MTEAQFIAAQQNGQVKAPKQPAQAEPDVIAALSALQKQFDKYRPFLETLRIGLPTIGTIHLSGTQSISSGSPVKVNLNTEDFSNATNIDVATNHRITATQAGYYLVTANVGFSSNASAATYEAYIYTNGSAATNAFASPGSGVSVSVPITAVLSLSAGDYIELFGSYSAGSSTFNAGNLSIIKL